MEVNGEIRHLYFLHDVHPRTIAARLRRCVESTETRVVLREQWREFPTTWHAVQKLADEFVARPGASFEWVSRDDLTRLLALRTFVMQARSHDVVGPEGEPVSHRQVADWLQRALAPQAWSISKSLTRSIRNESPRTIRSSELSMPSLDEAPSTIRDSIPPVAASGEHDPVLSSAPYMARGSSPHAAAPAAPSRGAIAPAESRALKVLEHLRVASLDRLIREVTHANAWVTRKQVIEELHSLGPRIRWFGRAIVALSPEDSA